MWPASGYFIYANEGTWPLLWQPLASRNDSFDCPEKLASRGQQRACDWLPSLLSWTHLSKRSLCIGYHAAGKTGPGELHLASPPCLFTVSRL
jgi:hypothetical protein